MPQLSETTTATPTTRDNSTTTNRECTRLSHGLSLSSYEFLKKAFLDEEGGRLSPEEERDALDKFFGRRIFSGWTNEPLFDEWGEDFFGFDGIEAGLLQGHISLDVESVLRECQRKRHLLVYEEDREMMEITYESESGMPLTSQKELVYVHVFYREGRVDWFDKRRARK